MHLHYVNHRPRAVYLQVVDGDVEGNKVHVRHNVSIVKNKPILGTPKTKRGNSIVTLPDDTVEILRQKREALAQAKCDSPFVFPSRTGGFLPHGNLLRTLRLYGKRAEVIRVRMQDLRHPYASMRIAHGGHREIVTGLGPCRR